MSGPKFIPFPGEEQIPWPYAFDPIDSQLAWLWATRSKLQNLCDLYLNEPSDGKLNFTAVQGAVLFFLNSYPRLRSLAPGYSAGFARAAEAGFSFLVRYQPPGTILPRYTFFIPYIFMTYPWGVVSGRSILGLTKELSRISQPNGSRNPTDSSLDTLVLPTVEADQEVIWKQLFKITRRHLLASESAEPAGGTTLEGLIDWQKGKFQGEDHFDASEIEALDAALDDIVSTMASKNLALKQIRDAMEQETAAYQAIVNSELRLNDFLSWGVPPLGIYDLGLNSFPSQPIAEDLGLIPTTRGGSSFTLLFPYWYSANATYGFSENLYVNTGSTED